MASHKILPEPRCVSDQFWSVIAPLLPAKARAEGRSFQRRPGAGRKPLPARQAFEAVLHVLRTGTPWRMLPKTYGSASALHRRFDEWCSAGVFGKIWHLGLAEHEEMEGISWEWQRDSATVVAVRNHESVTVRGAHLRRLYPVQTRNWEPSRVHRRRKAASFRFHPEIAELFRDSVGL